MKWNSNVIDAREPFGARRKTAATLPTTIDLMVYRRAAQKPSPWPGIIRTAFVLVLLGLCALAAGSIAPTAWTPDATIVLP